MAARCTKRISTTTAENHRALPISTALAKDTQQADIPNIGREAQSIGEKSAKARGRLFWVIPGKCKSNRVESRKKFMQPPRIEKTA
jgi:hypothetical protein